MFTVRVNTLKVSKAQIISTLAEGGVDFEEVAWCPRALLLKNTSQKDLEKTGFFQKGFLYAQGLSSMLVALTLNPQPGDNVLDACAAPGSKATHMASLMQNEGRILAVDVVKDRYYRLRAVISLMGASCVVPKLTDARRLRLPDGGFDKILVDAPCSSEGRFKVKEEKSFAYWSPRKIKEMAQKQKGLLLSAARLLKAGGVLVYSTCTFASEENEDVINWLLKKTNGALALEEVSHLGIQTYPPLLTWGKKNFNQDVSKCCRVLPTETMEGFFIAKLRKKDGAISRNDC